MDFLKAFGVTDATAAFTEFYTVEKDRRLYKQWLEDVQKFVRKQATMD